MFKIPPLTSDVIALSSDALVSPSLDFNLSAASSGSHAFGWGLGWYPGKQVSAAVIKDPSARAGHVMTDAIADWANFRATTFFGKVRGADSGYGQADTQPFMKSYAGRDWLFLHNGDLDRDALAAIQGRPRTMLEPLGGTDSELAFCDLLGRMHDLGARQLSDVPAELLHAWFLSFDALGSADMYLADGERMVVFHGSQSPKQLYYTRVRPPERQDAFESAAIRLKIADPRDTYRTVFVVCSAPFFNSELRPMRPGQMMIVSHGALVWSSEPVEAEIAPVVQPDGARAATTGPLEPPPGAQGQTQSALAKSALLMPAPHVIVTNSRSIVQAPDGRNLSYRVYDVLHATTYKYSKPVEHSTHLFRLQPTEDPMQSVIHSSLTLSSTSEEVQFEDVFGNQSIHCTIGTPYEELTVTAKSRVKIFAAPPDDHSLARRQSTIPLVWMPWQRQMMMPYLLPPELPEPQLSELTDYAMSFVERNDHHLIRTIKDINTSIYKDYEYAPGVTSLNTTPFEVYASRKGVCQDFANLFICLTRLLSIPARYRMGYIYTGANYDNKIQSDASHAWAEVYFPYVGWRGFDPTNGCSVGQDHVRVACGRNYIDATPTSGTIYKGGGDEILSVEVKMHDVVE